MRKLASTLTVLPAAIIAWMALGSSMIVGDAINRFAPCIQSAQDSFPCQGIYEIWVMKYLTILSIAGVLLLIVSFLKKEKQYVGWIMGAVFLAGALWTVTADNMELANAYFPVKAMSAASTITAPYEAVVTFGTGVRIEFPDFAMQYAGISVAKPRAIAPLEITNFNFVIMQKNGSQLWASWSSGLGDLGPAHFVVDGTSYALELSYTEKGDKWLGPDEMVVSRAAQ